MAKYYAGAQSGEIRRALVQEFRTGEGSSSYGYIFLDSSKVTNLSIARSSDLVILDCPPDEVEAVLGEAGIAAGLEGKTLVSLVPGVTISQVESALGGGASTDEKRCWVFRAAPTLAASRVASATAIAGPTDPEPIDKITNTVMSFFKFVGSVYRVDEDKMSAASVACGASPAFMALACEGIVDGIVAGGLPREQALAMTAQALAGTAAMMLADKSPSQVREEVCASSEIAMQGIIPLKGGIVRESLSLAVVESMATAQDLEQKDDRASEVSEGLSSMDITST